MGGGTEDNTNAPNSSTAPEEDTQTEETDNTPEASPTSEDPRDCQGEDIGGNGWRRRLIDQARMQANDVDSMTPSEFVLHRRRLTCGVRVSPVLAVLMDEIQAAKRNHRSRCD